jgi:hypothetical protein
VSEGERGEGREEWCLLWCGVEVYRQMCVVCIIELKELTNVIIVAT